MMIGLDSAKVVAPFLRRGKFYRPHDDDTLLSPDGWH